MGLIKNERPLLLSLSEELAVSDVSVESLLPWFLALFIPLWFPASELCMKDEPGVSELQGSLTAPNLTANLYSMHTEDSELARTTTCGNLNTSALIR